VTVLPAVLALLGPKIDAGRVRLPGRRGRGGPGRPSLADRLLRRPLAAAGLVTALLLALAYPALSLHMAQPSPIALTAPDDPALQTLAAVQSTFPGAGEPAYVVVQVPVREREALSRELARLEALAVGDGIAHPPFRLTWSGDHTAAALTLPLTGNGANPASRQAVQTLRHTLIPQTVGHIAGARAYVTGATAGDVDFTGQVRAGLPYAVAFVLVLAFGLLVVAFRSVIVPLTAVVLNLLSVAAAYGVLVLVFQHRWAEPVLRFRSNGTITAWLPLFLFVILFGLSMDYHVFILSRIKEAVTDGEPTRDAIRHSIGRTAGVITAAALVHELIEARDDKRLLRLQRQLATYKLLIIDELGYVPLSTTGAELLFEVFSQRYERGSTLVTSNLPFDEWTSVFGSERLTGALLDRLTHHVHILEMNGDSYRLKQSKQRQRRT